MALLAEWVSLMRTSVQPMILHSLTVQCFKGPLWALSHLRDIWPLHQQTLFLMGNYKVQGLGIRLDLWIQGIRTQNPLSIMATLRYMRQEAHQT